MKKINLPKILSIISFIVIVASIPFLLIYASGGLVIYFFSFIISPIIILLLIIWKLFNKKIENKYYTKVLIINIILFISSLFLTIGAFDNFMSLS